MKKDFIQTLKILLAAVVLSLGITYVYAWTAPTKAPPGGNTPAPLNVGPTTQTKLGRLVINANPKSQYKQGLVVSGDIVTDGTIKVSDTLTPTGKKGDPCVGLVGTIKFTGGNLLACAGNNTWQGLTSVTNTVVNTPPPTSNTINLTISKNTAGYVIAKQPELANAISAGKAVKVELTINSGVVVSGGWSDLGVVIASFPALSVNFSGLSSVNLPTGSSVHIINRGSIIGVGGIGGGSGAVVMTKKTPTYWGKVYAANSGNNGGDAINITGTITSIDNYGKIYGGGGGGGGGASLFCIPSFNIPNGASACLAGGGGGGGAGSGFYSGGGGGGGNTNSCVFSTAVLGSNGSVGGTTGGVGGVGDHFTAKYLIDNPDSKGATGGTGGGYGKPGTAGGNKTNSLKALCPNGQLGSGTPGPWRATIGYGGKGGVAGYAIRSGGTTLKWGIRGDVKGSF